MSPGLAYHLAPGTREIGATDLAAPRLDDNVCRVLEALLPVRLTYYTKAYLVRLHKLRCQAFRRRDRGAAIWQAERPGSAHTLNRA